MKHRAQHSRPTFTLPLPQPSQARAQASVGIQLNWEDQLRSERKKQPEGKDEDVLVLLVEYSG